MSLLTLTLCAFLVQGAKTAPVPATKPPKETASRPPATPLSFKEFFEPGKKELNPSAKLLSLNGKRVRLIGYMANTEEGFKGGFYLCPRPVFSDEGGNGDADIPPESVFVVLRSATGKEVAHKPMALEATGILEIGPKTDEDGHVTRIRLVLDKPDPLSSPKSPAKKVAKKK